MIADPISILASTRVLPVVTIDDADDASALARALLAGGLPVIEITLRTSGAVDAIRRIAAEVPDAVVGAGTVTSLDLAVAARAAGARFLVSPGLDDDVVRAAPELGVPALPGVATATELQRAAALGATIVKLFPARQIGGPTLVDAFSAVWPEMRFVPTGGISADDASEYLERPEVLAVGGSWMAPRRAIASRDWAAIEAAARSAAALGGRAS